MSRDDCKKGTSYLRDAGCSGVGGNGKKGRMEHSESREGQRCEGCEYLRPRRKLFYVLSGEQFQSLKAVIPSVDIKNPCQTRTDKVISA